MWWRVKGAPRSHALNEDVIAFEAEFAAEADCLTAAVAE
jgi:hypothetical protein